ncbi:C4-dicarboxylate transporter/malic acid transport protein [Pseudomonas chlororaphis subsp. aurantiaca]|uniref:TDT family transporter n=1 Tax=Pseudomonas chlororaphis subsp. aurantiaca TaxID=86192 RepID=A0AAJ0ZJJ9_9PSED|nr:TDT family transporter [Pseudomonas chlororaphis]AIS11782.1 C4-dicarboxylate ABC transporter [Pseudomonas chlororaphis subsp. aurantiaca]AZD37410.1 C4-dicarboxylate transporter/malic acid transport protein [Pseudomonas chlororaphis subsp. aurantiaca]AZD43749.1 C4-dicarboxylate transporter/malic acid transport protein [Pseudomonas chlororaphis subsp. aurantiaca]AZD49988.1 C4-dicarboxylate transporter/malic acid transport protein [Pseudomonas chlororaphis subsp. aurantiaca]AZD68670.1 C4-dicar
MTCPNTLRTGRPLSQLQHPREAIRQFTPNWFAATMGTGVLALALAQLPLRIPGLHLLAEGLWLFTIVLFVLFSAAYAARWIMFFDEARRIFGHSTVSMFFGTIPMGLATIINGFLLFGVPRWGDGVVQLAELLWWLDVALSLACGVLIPYMMFTRQEHRIDQMTAVWLLPVVAAEVAAASGGLLAPHLVDAHSQLVMLVTSYVLWAFSLPVAFSILTILLLRMALHKLPHESMAASSWLALGPIGTGALGMLLLGADAPAIFAANGMAGVGEIAEGLGLVAGITLWGFGLWWMLTALLITLRYLRDGIPFNLGWWGFTFPLGVYALTTLKLAATLNLTFFAVFGSLLVLALALMWLLVGKRTLQGAYRGELFVSPCIAGLAK